MLVHEDGSTYGTIGGGEMESRVIHAARESIKAKKPRQLTYALVDPSQGDPGVCGGNVTIYLEPFMPQTTIFILGAGHIGKAVSELSSWLGYKVIVWDDQRRLDSSQLILTINFMFLLSSWMHGELRDNLFLLKTLH